MLTPYGNVGKWLYMEGILVMDPATVEMLMIAALLLDIPGVPLAFAAICRYGRYSYIKEGSVNWVVHINERSIKNDS